ncbi:hypothetical protein [Rickettsia helvetica]|uniref:Recombinase RecB n=1 Tax=Rickettsia helvetica TaxID=35789 RepID=A0ABM9NAR7_RICHE|nr:hypothetical protein [Rickettsia helvetica]MCZ6883858.1 recombinase RecB [Rickettsia endosymbiont of Ixodes ricinus]MCZ6896162.1 recombinase RecB [Rickettsia endosymbiont of Ixodes ricinus]
MAENSLRVIDVIQIAANAHQTFKSSTITEKHNLVNLVFTNQTLKPEKLDFMLRPPFDSCIKT